MLAIILVGLGAAWYAIEVRHQVRVTVFQPFRMATVARGIALVFVAGRLVALWRQGDWLGRLRAILIAVAFTGDWLLVVVTLAELAVSAAEAIRTSLALGAIAGGSSTRPSCSAMLALGLNFLAHHDTEYGHIPLLAALGAGLADRIVGTAGEATRSSRSRWAAGPGRRARLRGGTRPRPGPSRWRRCWRRRCRWIMPLARHPLVRGLISRCRFAAVPADDIERLALWCRDHTPATARFIGPPGPKTFGSGRCGAWPSTGRRAPIMRTGWPTGSRGFRTMSISTARPRSSCVPTWATVMASKHATRRRATPSGRPWPCGRGDVRRRRGPERTAPSTSARDRQPGRSSCCTSRGVTPSTGSSRSRSSSASGNAADG